MWCMLHYSLSVITLFVGLQGVVNSSNQVAFVSVTSSTELKLITFSTMSDDSVVRLFVRIRFHPSDIFGQCFVHIVM